MKKEYIFSIFLLFAVSFFNTRVNGQRNGDLIKVDCKSCATSNFKVTEENKMTLISCNSAVKYINNYRKKFRKSDKRKEHHPQFVNFSSKTFLDIYAFFKADKLKEYRGIDFYFSFLSKDHPKQIQIFLTPEKKDTSSDFKAFDLLSNTGMDYSNILLNPVDAYQYKENYEDMYRSKKKHTKSVYLDTANFRFLGSFFEDLKYKNYKGVRAYFASYNKYLKNTDGGRLKNGQARRREITLVIIPVNEHGEPDFCAFGDFWKSYPHKMDGETGLNHGSLCPNYCPTE